MKNSCVLYILVSLESNIIGSNYIPKSISMYILYSHYFFRNFLSLKLSSNLAIFKYNFNLNNFLNFDIDIFEILVLSSCWNQPLNFVPTYFGFDTFKLSTKPLLCIKEKLKIKKRKKIKWIRKLIRLRKKKKCKVGENMSKKFVVVMVNIRKKKLLELTE